MRTEKELIIEIFHAIKRLGMVPSKRRNSTGIGKTFEDYAHVRENNIAGPDLYGYEIKSQRELANSYVTLFTKAPGFPKRANTHLRDAFGIGNEDNPDLKKLHVSMHATQYSLSYDKYQFRLINDTANRVIRIGVYDQSDRLIDNSVGYTYDSLERILESKLKKLFYVSADTEMRGDEEYFHFNKARIYEKPSMEKFLEMVDNGMIMYDIRIGSYGSGDRYGKIHDHGSGFRIQEENLHLLYQNYENVL